jgi:DNA-binding NarL/FixJ family response regulator
MSRASAATVPPAHQTLDANSVDGAPSVLVIETDRVVAAALQRMLRELGYDAWAAVSTAREAHELAAQKAPDVVVTDVRIQGPVDGIDAAYELRQQYDTAIIFISDQADDATVARAKRAEPSSYLIKPAGVAAIKVAMELALDQRDRDISVRALESSLAETAKVLLSALNGLPLAVQLEDAQDRVLHINPAFRVMFGLGEVELDLTGLDSATLMRQVGSRCEDTKLFEQIVDSLRCSPRSRVRDTIHLSNGRQVEMRFIPLSEGEQRQGQLWTYREVN